MSRPGPFPGRSLTSDTFWSRFNSLGESDQRRAREAHQQWLANPRHPGLRFKRVHRTRPVYSVRVNLSVRIVGVMSGDDMIWFWIGPHDEYEALLKTL